MYTGDRPDADVSGAIQIDRDTEVPGAKGMVQESASVGYNLAADSRTHTCQSQITCQQPSVDPNHTQCQRINAPPAGFRLPTVLDVYGVCHSFTEAFNNRCR